MIAIIPARGGSKGLPGKNTKLMHGVPLIGYTIVAAIKSKAVSRVIVSTDDSEIAKIAEAYGAEVPFLRPAYLAEDNSLAIDNYKHILQWLQDVEGVKVEDFCVLQPTSPLRNFSHIDEAVDLFFSRNADSVISYCEEHHPVAWHKYLTEEGRIIDLFKQESELLNRQEHKPSYFPNGAIYVFKATLIELGAYTSSNTFAYVMPRKFSVDIDTEDDFKYAEYLMDRN